MRAWSFALLVVLLSPVVAQSDGTVVAEGKVRALLAKGKVYKARALCSSALRAQPVASLYTLRADANNRLGEHSAGELDARSALRASPRSTAALLQLAIAEQGLGAKDSALVHFQEVLRSEPSAEAHLGAAMALRSKGDAAAAIAQLDQALARVPDDARFKARVLRTLAECHMVQMDTAAASKAYTQALALTPDDPVLLNSRGWFLYAGTGRHAEAIADYDRAIRQNPNYSYAFNNRGWSRYKTGDRDRAIADIERAKRRKDSNPYVFRNLAVIALDAGDKETACKHLRTALDLGFTALFGNEVEALRSANCADQPAPPPTIAPSNAPTKQPPTRSNAP